MSTISLAARPLALAADTGRAVALGFPVWLVFLLALEPENIARAAAAGQPLGWQQEVVRILTASLLGAASTPAVLALARRFPVERHVLRNLAVQLPAQALLAFGLVTVSCVLAEIFGIGDSRPVHITLPLQLNANWALVTFCLVAVSSIAHAIQFSAVKPSPTAAPAPLAVEDASPFIGSVAVKARGGVTMVQLSSVKWIESQGNYLALHSDSGVHLLRETMQSFEAKLDPAAFVRVHRRMLVALRRVEALSNLPSGDASAMLSDGTALRVSRSFREKVRQALKARAD